MEISRILDRNVKDVLLLQPLEIRIVKGRGSWLFHQCLFPNIYYKIISLILYRNRIMLLNY